MVLKDDPHSGKECGDRSRTVLAIQSLVARRLKAMFKK